MICDHPARMRRLLILALFLFVLFSCKKHEPAATSESSTTAASASATTASATSSATLPSHSGENLVALASGAMPVVRASAPEQGGEAYYMFDEDPTTGWASQDGKFGEPTVVEMADRGVIKSVEFDEQRIAYDGRLPHDVLIEVSDTSATDGF